MGQYCHAIPNIDRRFKNSLNRHLLQFTPKALLVQDSERAMPCLWDGSEPENRVVFPAKFMSLLDCNQKSLSPMSTCLARWIEKDPVSAIAWARKSDVIFPKISDNMSAKLAIKDPAQAFWLIGKLEIKNSNYWIFCTRSAKRSENQTVILSALHDCVLSLPAGEGREQALERSVKFWVPGALQRTFTAGSEWIVHAGFTAEQFVIVTDQIRGNSRKIINTANRWIGLLRIFLKKK